MAFPFRFVSIVVMASLQMASGATHARNSISAGDMPIPPPRQKQPVIAVLALNEGTETTDFLVPYAVLRRANVATVEAVASKPGRVNLMPALAIDLPNDVASFDRRYPMGADYVIVPAMHSDNDPVIIGWIHTQAAKGAVIVAICSGALVAGNAGLLDHRRFAGHWYDKATLIARHPGAIHVPNRRYIADHGIVSTTGVSASVPISVAIIEAIAGRARATSVADSIGASDWGTTHDATPFRIDARNLQTLAINTLTFWRRETIAIPVKDGIDDIQLALAADAWSRTYRSTAVAVASGSVQMRSGLTLEPASPTTHGNAYWVRLGPDTLPANQLRSTLIDIGQRYGHATRKLVELTMEYDDRGGF
ncbi:DJ-1/PfpI family protein [Cupriavidus sp. WKF15]|uniref:DJ-1/PfpI family protein n=1 Tax=Cupriavidus sp. WKF15 TaxID=3032282 RepID=UPI0023E21F92|nr:DJ-1/PfpI family protein [Cupriavidus sp. WKF15]WER48675.1 DJ-1/PfpI family protein [Cupriavidus sp. WKF15]